ncbi:MAG: enoyl-CoA hydratase/isomerase family protein [Marinicellaceae bacterium]
MSELVIFEIINGLHGDIGKITLNNPKSLNALNIEMIDAMQGVLDTCEKNNDIKAVFLQGTGDKAFCAGGDVVGLYHSMKETKKGDIPNKASMFFTKEYDLDYRLHKFPKPIISWGNGIVMGGGIGLAAACSHRIVTEKSMYAMPEVTIGLYPDVGASWFFNRMPHNIGMYLGLTGSRMNASDAIYTKLADFYLESDSKADLITKLSEFNWSGDTHKDIHNIIQAQNEKNNIQSPVSQIRENYDDIQNLFKQDGLQEIVNNLTHSEPKSKWLRFGQKGFLKGCPITYALVYEQIKRAKHMSLKQVFDMELIMSIKCAMNGDLQEGIRALLIDKDGQPNWKVKSVQDISHSQIEDFFQLP